ncbi:Xaa-Pro aminopeptidase [Albidovulum inexpectatum]|uniref:Xaa-Pro aminopeptidase n=1 Tax=Albidovulum inexpectatum TaxID=196587 RepID=A0A2S5JID4_9RHOB|nr:aminopeptidase P family protein [Albidovulum inexpectatum]PPB81233.1 Xaa-Pro aminopeptidase [Albidovulum inexpectatum]
MFQSFETTASPEQGPPRLTLLRREMARAGLDGFIVPRADAHQGEYVAPCDERLAWLTGFTGSAGFCIALRDEAGIFVDGRYRAQVKAQVDLTTFTPVPWPETRPGPWLREKLPQGGRIGFDPWLHTHREIADMRAALSGSGIELVPSANLVDAIWTDRPAPPRGKVRIQPLEYAGESADDKRRRIGAELDKAGQQAVVLTLPDSISWLFNIRGADIPRNPVVQAFAVLRADGTAQIFIDPAKLDDALRAHLGPDVDIRDPDALLPSLGALQGPVRVDPATAPLAVADALSAADIPIAWAEDPCLLPKACKNPAEIRGMEEAHLIDGAAMVEFLAWLDETAPGGALTEIDVVTKLEEFRRATGQLREISFETICGAGPHGALPHYRVTRQTNRALNPGDVVVIDSGGQYPFGTTDITRTILVPRPDGAVDPDARAAFTRVLNGMIAISRLRWPEGLSGAHLDAIARYPLWLAGQDYDHGTGHGVGCHLSVHEGPQRLARTGTVAFQPGMILSNEPGYYREGAFGIRIENLILVEPAPDLPGADPHRRMLHFRTLTFAPIDRRLIDVDALSVDERGWLNAYHAQVAQLLAHRVSEPAARWLREATAPI